MHNFVNLYIFALNSKPLSKANASNFCVGERFHFEKMYTVSLEVHQITFPTCIDKV